MFVIMTDGMENASRKYSSKKVKEMIEHEKKEYCWEFLFIGANIDAVETASNFGIAENRAVDYIADNQGTSVAYDTFSDVVTFFRNSVPIPPSWSDKINKDYRKRK